MTGELNYLVAQQRIADLQQNAERAGLARNVAGSRTPTSNQKPIARLAARLLTVRAWPYRHVAQT